MDEVSERERGRERAPLFGISFITVEQRQPLFMGYRIGEIKNRVVNGSTKKNHNFSLHHFMLDERRMSKLRRDFNENITSI